MPHRPCIAAQVLRRSHFIRGYRFGDSSLRGEESCPLTRLTTTDARDPSPRASGEKVAEGRMRGASTKCTAPHPILRSAQDNTLPASRVEGTYHHNSVVTHWAVTFV